MEEIKPGLYENIPNEIYHQSTEWLSSSQIKVALVSAKAFKTSVLDKKGKKKSSDAKDFGSVVHKYILEMDDFFNEYYVGDMSGIDLRTKVGKEDLQALKNLAGAKTLISQEDFDNACLMRDSIMSHKDLRKYIETPGLVEASLYVVIDHMLPGGEMVPVKVRVRFDKLIKGQLIFDLKTSKNPAMNGFKKDATGDWGYGYDVSAALYKKAWRTYSGEDLPFVWGAVRNDSPWEAASYRMSQETLTKGEARLSRALTTIIMGQRNGIWEMQETEEEL